MGNKQVSDDAPASAGATGTSASKSRGHRTPMPIELRAKQFMPFAAVTGLEAALREKEREREEREHSDRHQVE